MKVLEIQTWIDMFDPSELNLDKLEEYLEFIKEAVDRYDPNEYGEKHHILPSCLDEGCKYDNEKVKITAKDHFLAHMKLVECFNKNSYKHKMIYAYKMLCNGYKNNTGTTLTPEEYEDSKIKFAEMMKDRMRGNSHMKGKVCSPETRQRKSELGRLRVQSLETRQRISESNKGKRLGKKASLETLEKMSKALSGSNNPMYGVHLKGSQNHMYGKHHSEETRKKISETKKGVSINRVWVTDGVTNKFISKDDPIPEGWRYGRIMKKGDNNEN